ncbi:MAG: hypothetical protein JSU04_11415 [Bdellovibrionales bacterium]|nr:hypothetical protein [Bdellovibrionales bacterium]
MSVKLLLAVLLFSILSPQISVAGPADIAAFCGENSDIGKCDLQKLEDLNRITKKPYVADEKPYSEQQKLFFKSIEKNCGELQNTCMAYIHWQRASLPEPERSPASEKSGLGLWGSIFTLLGLYLLYKAFVKGTRVAFGGLSRVWNAMDSEIGREARRLEKANRQQNFSSSDTDPNYFANDKVNIDFGYGNSDSSSPNPAYSSSSEPEITQWRVEGHYVGQKSYTIHFQINADSADSARAQVRRDKKDFVIVRVSRY